MLTRLVRFLKWLFLPEKLPPPAEEPTRKAGFFAWLVGRERLEFDEAVRSSRPGLLRTIFAPDRLDEAPAAGRKSRSLLAWLFSREKL